MEEIFYIFIFILGLIIGSFLNCVIYRLEKEESFLKGRSKCPKCRQELNWKDLIPIFSFLFLKGKCRYCKEPISWHYPLVEFATGLLFVLIFWSLNLEFISDFGFRISDFFTVCYLLTVCCLLVIIFVYDLKHYLIPDRVIFPGIGLALLYDLFLIFSSAEAWVKAEDFGFAILPSLLFLAIILFSRGRWMGLGDFNLAVFMGLFLGWPNIIAALFFGVFLGAIMGVGLIFLGRKKLSSEIPFGPFLVGGTFIAFFWGEKLINWYFDFLI